jgi:hypothetical protein
MTVEAITAPSLEDRLGEAGAARVLRSRWRIAARRGARTRERLELVRLPVAIRGAVAPGGARSGVHFHVVERVLGHGWSVVLPAAAAGDRAAGTLLPARLDLDACEPRLLAQVLRYAVAMRLRRAAPLPPLEAARAAEYPFWVRHRHDRRGHVRFDAADAVTGRRASSPQRAAIAAALIDAAATS